MYRAFGLLRPDTDFTIEESLVRLTAKFPGFEVARAGDRVTVSQGGWWIALERTSGPQVRAETEGLIGKLAGVEPAEAEALVASGARVEVWTDEPDPLMEHFDHYLQVVEVLKSFNGLLAIDPKEPGVL